MTNEPLRVLIVDDEPLARQALRMMLEGDPEIAVVGECSGVESAEIIERTSPDILLLDVQMPEVDGFELLDQVGVDRAPTVVFVTAYADHALRAFDAHAIDYVLKPVADARLAQALARAKTLARGRRAGETADASRLGALVREHSRITRRLLVRDRGRTQVIEVADIDRIEAADYYAELHVGGETHLLRETMSELAQRLDPERFFRIHRSTIINLDRVREIVVLMHGDRELVLADGTRVRLSRTRREEFERLFGAARREP